MNKTKLGLWLEYNDAYIKIQRNPRLRTTMQNDPGVKFMRRGWDILLIVVLLLSILNHVL